jgi:hypothetical protein
MAGKSDVIAEVCKLLTAGNDQSARDRLATGYPFAPDAITKRAYGKAQSARVFVRDGFIDRYSGDRLVFPPVLRVIAMALPAEFRYHPNWKTGVTHSAFWEIGATIDHLKPVTRSGADDESNLMTTSMAHNSGKLNWTLAELGWSLHPPGDIKTWDGLLSWFLAYADQHPEVLSNSMVRQWHRAGRSAIRPPTG